MAERTHEKTGRIYTEFTVGSEALRGLDNGLYRLIKRHMIGCKISDTGTCDCLFEVMLYNWEPGKFGATPLLFYDQKA